MVDPDRLLLPIGWIRHWKKSLTAPECEGDKQSRISVAFASEPEISDMEESWARAVAEDAVRNATQRLAKLHGWTDSQHHPLAFGIDLEKSRAILDAAPAYLWEVEKYPSPPPVPVNKKKILTREEVQALVGPLLPLKDRSNDEKGGHRHKSCLARTVETLQFFGNVFPESVGLNRPDVTGGADGILIPRAGSAVFFEVMTGFVDNWSYKWHLARCLDTLDIRMLFVGAYPPWETPPYQDEEAWLWTPKGKPMRVTIDAQPEVRATPSQSPGEGVYHLRDARRCDAAGRLRIAEYLDLPPCGSLNSP